MTSDNSNATAGSVVGEQTGQPHTPRGMFKFVPYQPDQTFATSNPLPPHRACRAKAGLTFIQYQPPVTVSSMGGGAYSTADASNEGVRAPPQTAGSPEAVLGNPPSTTTVTDTSMSDNQAVDTYRGTTTHPVTTPAASPPVEAYAPGNPIAGEEHGVALPPIPSATPAPSHGTDITTNVSAAGMVTGVTTAPVPESPVPASSPESPVPASSSPPPVASTESSSTQIPSPTSTTPPAEITVQEPALDTATTPNVSPANRPTPLPLPTVDIPNGALACGAPEVLDACRGLQSDDDDDDDDFPDEHSTHRLRNPDRPVIPSGSRPKHMKSKNFTVRVAREVRKAKDKLFDADIEALLGKLSVDMKALGEKHDRSEDCIRQLITHRTNYKSTKKPNLYNALVHRMALEINSDRPPGDRVPLQEIQKMASEAQEKLTDTDREELLQELSEHRDTIRGGVRCNNIAANQDFQSTVTQIGSELTALTKRTDCVAIAFFAPGHINDTTFPCWIHSNNAGQFITDELKMSGGEFSRKLELWAKSRNTKTKGASKLVALQKECANLIVEGLRNITGRRDLKMSYEKYDTDLRLAFKVQLCGWPHCVSFQSPYNVCAMSDIRLLHDTLKAGKCAWVEMSCRGYDDLKRELRGRAPKPKRQKQSKGKRKRSDNDENVDLSGQPPTNKRAKKGKKVNVKQSSGFRSRSVISSEDEE